jgi:hypothetical protein
MHGVWAGAVWCERIRLLVALDAGSAIRVERHGMGQHQRERLVLAVWQHVHAEFRAELLAHLGHGVVPACILRAAVCRWRWCGGGSVTIEFGDEGVQGLVGF